MRPIRLRRRSSGAASHVTLVVENVPLGIDQRLRKQLPDLLAAGHRVSVVTMRDPSNAPYRDRPGLRLVEFPPPPQGAGPVGYLLEYSWAFVWATIGLCRLRLRGRLDVVQFCQPPDIYFPLAWVLRRGGTRVVVDQRDLMPELLASRYDAPPASLTRVLHLLERLTQRNADVTVTVNGYLRDRVVAAGARTDSVVVVVNGPVLARRERVTEAPKHSRDDRHRVVWAGKMGRQDRVDLVLRVADDVVRRHGRTDCDFVLLGDGECLDDLKAETARLGLDPWVHFTDWVTEDEVFSQLAAADVGIDSSLQVEVTPVKALEYMAFGLPIACFDLQETRRLSEGAALLAPAGDVGALSDLVDRLLGDPALRAELGAVGRERVERELAWERQSRRYLEAVAPGGGRSSAARAPRGQPAS